MLTNLGGGSKVGIELIGSLYPPVDSLFLFKLALTFLVGSLWLTGATILAERFGSKIGGVIAGMPSTIVIALFFIGWTQTPLAASQATVVVPLVMGIDGLFIITY